MLGCSGGGKCADVCRTALFRRSCRAANAAEGITAAYAYRLVPSKAEHDQAEVEAEIALSFGAGDGLTIQASGEVWAYSVSDGETLWEGPLDGETWYQGRRYRVIVGFAKRGSSDNAQMSITLQDAAGTLNPIALSFGSIVTPEMAQAVLQNAENDRQPEVRQQNAAWMGLGGSEAEPCRAMNLSSINQYMATSAIPRSQASDSVPGSILTMREIWLPSA